MIGVSVAIPASSIAFWSNNDGVVQSSGKIFGDLVERRLVEFQANRPLQFAANPRFGRQFAIQVGIDQQAASATRSVSSRSAAG